MPQQTSVGVQLAGSRTLNETVVRWTAGIELIKSAYLNETVVRWTAGIELMDWLWILGLYIVLRLAHWLVCCETSGCGKERAGARPQEGRI